MAKSKTDTTGAAAATETSATRGSASAPPAKTPAILKLGARALGPAGAGLVAAHEHGLDGGHVVSSMLKELVEIAVDILKTQVVLSIINGIGWLGTGIGATILVEHLLGILR